MKHRIRTLPLAGAVVLLLGVAPLGAQAIPIWRLQLDHAIRPAEGSAGMIGDVIGMAITPSGTVYVAEATPPRVTRYDAKGRFIDVFMRQGSGPREVQYPSIAVHGDTLVTYDGRQERVIKISPAGRVLAQYNIDVNAVGFPVWVTRDGTILVDAFDSAHGLNVSARRIAPSGRIDTLAWNQRFADNQFVQYRSPQGVLKGGPFTAATEPGIDPAGHIVIGGTRTSTWYVVSERDTLARVSLPDHVVTIPERVRDSAWQTLVRKFAGTPFADGLDKKLLPTTLPAWISFDINPIGEWWIGRPDLTNSLAGWDVVRDGKLVGHAVVPTPIAGANHFSSRMAFGSDRIALLHEDENDVPWIGVYRIVRDKR